MFSQKRSACLVYNPVAGQGDPEADLRLIRSYLEAGIDLDVRLTTAQVGADQIAQEALGRGVDLVIASGGDGTLSAVAEAMVDTGVPFGVISRGTANAFAKALGLPLAIEAACESILDGMTRPVDAARCNGLPMVLLAGVGLEAGTIARADRETKNRLGALAYFWAGLQQLGELEPFEAMIETPDGTLSGRATAITIANAAPPTSVLAQGSGGCCFDDGLLDLTIFAPHDPAEVVVAAFDLWQSALRSEANLRTDIGHLLVPWVRLTTNPPQQIALDGEVIGLTPLEVVSLPASLRLIVPVEQLLQTLEPVQLNQP